LQVADIADVDVDRDRLRSLMFQMKVNSEYTNTISGTGREILEACSIK
jgi:hypothetical protein